MTSYVKITEGLEEHQSLSLYHELMRDGQYAASPSEADRDAFISEMVEKVSVSNSFTPARKRSLHERLAMARGVRVDAPIFYATQRIEQRSHRAKVALDDYYSNSARALGVSIGDVRSRLRASYEESKRERSLEAPTEWHNEFRSRPGQRWLPMDRHTAYGMWRIDNEVAAATQQAQARPTITQHMRVASPGVSAIGYDPETRRLEVEFRSRPGRFYAFQNVPRATATEFYQSGEPTRFFNANIRGRHDFSYASLADEDAAATVLRCASCGQFAGTGHNCPPHGSPVEAAEMATRMRIQQRVLRAREAVASGTVEERIEARVQARSETPEQAAQAVDAEDRLAGLSPETTMRHRQQQRLEARIHPYRGGGGTFRCTALSTVRSILEEEPFTVVPVTATISRSADAEGNPVTLATLGNVSGRVTISRAGGVYRVRSSHPDDAGAGEHLQCTCLDYRTNYDCVHVNQLLGDMQRRVNQDWLRTPHAVSDAVRRVSATIEREHLDSVAAQKAAIAADTISPVSYVDTPSEFQREYSAAIARRDAGEQVVPYMREDATNGLGAPGTGRGFGVELEFRFPDNTPYDQRGVALNRIGAELHSAGLTRRIGQEGYHSAQRRGYTEGHQGGWSFEQDGSVDGEVVSPIMYDTPETWENLEKVCRIVTRNGGIATVQTGAHVHVSTGDYDSDVNNHVRLIETMRANEDVVRRVAANPTTGRHRGGQYTQPNPAPAAGYSSISGAVAGSTGYRDVNLTNASTGNRSDHAEFRVWDGTLEPAVIQTQIKVSLAMTQAAFRGEPSGDHEPVGSHRAQSIAARQVTGETRLTGDAWRASTASFRRFADSMFRRPEDKAQLTALFAVNKWQGARR